MNDHIAFDELARLLPHRPPMRFIEKLIASDSEQVVCEITAGNGCFTSIDGPIPIAVGIEYLGQACALLEGIRRSKSELPAPAGAIVALRDVRFFANQLEKGETLLAKATYNASNGTTTIFDGALFRKSDQALLMNGRITVHHG